MAFVYKDYDRTIQQYQSRLKFLALSLNGGAEGTHYLIRQKGSFDRVMKATRYYLDKGVNLKWVYTVNSKNIDEIPRFIDLAQKMKVKAIKFGGIIPTEYNRELQLDWYQKVLAFNYLKTMKKQLSIPVEWATSLFTYSDENRFCRNIDQHGPTINARGEYIFCCDTIGQGAVLGNLQNESFADLYQKGVQTAAWLKAERKRRIEIKECFMGFNSCAFCNELLKDKIRHAA